jgi:all-trans-retinol dehydrogenase (NAD+)
VQSKVTDCIQALTYATEQQKLIRLYHCDITSQEAIQTSAQAIRSELGSPSILINNAGIGNSGTILDIPPNRLRKIFDVNIISHWSTVKEFLPGMLARQKGHIMAVSSLAAFVSLAGAVDYGCTKSAMLSFHEGLAQEIKHWYKCPQIRTTIVHPGWTKSAITENAALASLKRKGVKLLDAEYVAKAMVNQIIAGKSGQLILGPTLAPALAPRIRALPAWLQEIIRDGQAKVVNRRGSTAVE